MKPLTKETVEMVRQGLLNSEWCGFSKRDTVNQLCDLALQSFAVPEVDALDLPGTVKLAIWFHETYEELAPLYGYETRPESRTFDASSPNGKLMLAVCRKLRERYAFSPQNTTKEKS